MPAGPSHLRTVVRGVDHIDDGLAAEMYSLFESLYDAVSWERFLGDLAAKDRALLLFTPDGALAGFTLLRVVRRSEPFPCNVIYSGDTVVHPLWWARNDGVLAFFQIAGSISAESPDIPLYWAVIFNGYRTWRVMPFGFYIYWPHPDHEIPERIAKLRNSLGKLWFGRCYDQTSGLVRYPESIGHLKPGVGAIPDRLKHNRAVEFFETANPGYLEGDELFCLAEFSHSNLRPLARKRFALGVQGIHLPSD